jgi:carboxymethylenebutenolidase
MDARSVNRAASVAHPDPMPGLSQRIRVLASEHASRGYLVVAPSLFGRGRAGQDHGYKYQMGFSGEQLIQPLQPVDTIRAMLDVQTVVAWAQGQVAQGRVGIMGFCWGGLLAWHAACTMPQISAATSFYGGGVTNPQALSWKPLCPVLVHLPSKSLLMTQESMDEFVAVQSTRQEEKHLSSHDEKSPVVQIHRYDAAYGFDDVGSRQHDLVASQSARLKTSAFFDTHLNF